MVQAHKREIGAQNKMHRYYGEYEFSPRPPLTVRKLQRSNSGTSAETALHRLPPESSLCQDAVAGGTRAQPTHVIGSNGGVQTALPPKMVVTLVQAIRPGFHSVRLISHPLDEDRDGIS